MKKTILIITSLVIITSAVFPQSKVNIKNLEEYGGKNFKQDDDKPFTGIVFDLSKETGKKISETKYVQGMPHGKHVEWYNDGKKKEEGKYKNGIKHGLWTYYTEIGNGKYEVTYTADIYNIAVFTDNSDTDYKGSPFTDEPKQDGTYLFQEKEKYDFSKFPMVFASLKDGKPDGLFTEWYENGQKKGKGISKDGKPDGLFSEWYENGQKRKEVTYKDGKRDGLLTSWHEHGQKEKEETYETGESIDIKEFDEDGELIAYTYESAELFREQDNFKKALFILYQLVENNSEISPKAQYLIGDILMNDLLDFEQAISAYKMVIEKFPNSLQAPEAQFMIAYIYANVLDNSENARVKYNTFLQKYPDHDLTPSVKFELDFIGDDINDIPELKHITK